MDGKTSPALREMFLVGGLGYKPHILSLTKKG